MEHTFELMGRRLPYDMPGFLADGMRQAAVSSVPEAVTEVLRRQIAKWPAPALH
ncbi:MAG: hypothetical protein N838_02700 [Thiohalocapsa sp. PB-PSB1]|mgnify:CR=1 FL=1|jgi:hypothetical protein|nr:MAG: hypothetical protein N838_33035 [Thiohalocapsa sp. PB-PSB1]QQO52447.1 MAG: hypothetical protein N838_02700 [Thiohalocapsa sp. PB-PSB1]